MPRRGANGPLGACRYLLQSHRRPSCFPPCSLNFRTDHGDGEFGVIIREVVSQLSTATLRDALASTCTNGFSWAAEKARDAERHGENEKRPGTGST